MSQTKVKLEDEAKDFLKAKRKTPIKKVSLNDEKPPSLRDHYAGFALAGLLARGGGLKEEIKKEALAWADFMLES